MLLRCLKVLGREFIAKCTIMVSSTLSAFSLFPISSMFSMCVLIHFSPLYFALVNCPLEFQSQPSSIPGISLQ
ncbi:unnamed protein product [Prunus brigantina]